MNSQDRFYSPQKTLQTAINRIARKEPFWAKLLATTKIEIVPGYVSSVGAFHIKIGEAFITEFTSENRTSLHTTYLEALMLALILKIALLHEYRRKNRIPLLWNTACNIYILNLLNKNEYSLPPDIKTIYDRLGSNFQDATEEQIYDFLVQNTEFIATVISLEDLEKINEKIGISNDEKDEEDNDLTNDSKDLKSTKEYKEQKEKEAREIERTIRQILLQSDRIGETPEFFKEKIENLRKTNFSLEAILKDFIVKSIEPSRYNWQKGNRRYIQQGIFYPTLHEENIGGVLVAFDTSASCHAIVKKLLGVILEIYELYCGSDEAINLLYCDCQVHHQLWRRGIDLPEPVGGGGTSYAPVMDWVRQKVDENPDAFTCLLYMTDGACEQFGKNPGIPVIWLVLNIHEIPEPQLRKVPFGRVIIVEKQQLQQYT